MYNFIFKKMNITTLGKYNVFSICYKRHAFLYDLFAREQTVHVKETLLRQQYFE